MKAYAADDLHAEIAYLAFHLHWPHAELLDLEHIHRRRYIRQIGDINRSLTDGN
ncbi:hypothetical protein QZH56_01395 [Streptomyces olivoreticuli]|uniref:DUF6760 family protein n=1 Tax=Streptomyces olivoreticuli TaxID=68246 RepID=UPI0013C2F655|nr:DUF6760 family protein [Streptomyces olivoreticuli]WKK24351.1 hypothetical protein QZH56_01395 [Streptomyces olivoreticuli]